MRTASLANVKAKLGDHVDQCKEEGPLVITRSGKPVAVLFTPADEGDLERFLLARSRRFQEMLARSNNGIDEGKGLTEEEFWNEVESRAKQRQKPKTGGRSKK